MRFSFFCIMKIDQLYTYFLSSNGISTDSREVLEGQLFFALSGAKFNGNKFADLALEKGALYAIVDEPSYKKSEKHLLVSDVLKTLQELATFHRKKLGIELIAITGSNGKTTTKELLYSVLSEKFKVFATRGNLNNHIGVPLTLLSLRQEHEIAIVEMGANHVGEIAHLCEIAVPDFGIITNIGIAHLEGFGSVEGIVKGKTEMYAYLKRKGGKVFCNYSNNTLVSKIEEVGVDVLYYLNDSENQMLSGELLEANPFVRVLLKDKNQKLQEVQSNLIGEYNYENIMAAAFIGKFFGLEIEQIKMGLERYEPKNFRSQFIQTSTNVLVLDAYNANPSSMRVALQNFEKMPSGKSKVLILGDMLELGEASKDNHLQVIELISEMNLSKVYFVGKHFREVLTDDSCCFLDVSGFNDYLSKNPVKDSLVLIKGSRGIQLEKIVKYL